MQGGSFVFPALEKQSVPQVGSSEGGLSLRARCHCVSVLGSGFLGSALGAICDGGFGEAVTVDLAFGAAAVAAALSPDGGLVPFAVTGGLAEAGAVVGAGFTAEVTAGTGLATGLCVGAGFVAGGLAATAVASGFFFGTGVAAVGACAAEALRGGPV